MRVSHFQNGSKERHSAEFQPEKIAARSDTLLANGNPADLAIEAIRSLRTSLHFAMMEAKIIF